METFLEVFSDLELAQISRKINKLKFSYYKDVVKMLKERKTFLEVKKHIISIHYPIFVSDYKTKHFIVKIIKFGECDYIVECYFAIHPRKIEYVRLKNNTEHGCSFINNKLEIVWWKGRILK